jgi:hypothetical protein
MVSCKKCEDAKLTIPLKTYTGTELRIDGYYCYLSEESLKNKDTFYHVFVPLSDGRSLYTQRDNLSTMEQDFTDNDYAKSKWGWGAFKIGGNALMIEYWQIAFGSRCWHLNTYSCTILNDSTFLMDSGTSSGNSTNIGDIYQFKKYSVKPSPDPKFYN